MALVRVMLVEDEDAIVRPLRAAFDREGWEVRRFARAEEALASIATEPPDMVVLDVGLPGMSGLEALPRFKAYPSLPVLILTARGDPQDVVEGLERGADDYLSKPFRSSELVARMRGLLRRTSWERSSVGRPSVVHRIGGLTVEPEARRVLLDGRPVSLTAREFDLLAYLSARSPRLVGRQELMTEVWDAQWEGSDRTLDTHIAQLRRKLEADPGHPRYLHTTRGVGYRVADLDASDPTVRKGG
jgi:DNA-binding response OmpR family regulator